MRLYGNVEYKHEEVDQGSDNLMSTDSKVISTIPGRCGPIVPITHIESPD